MRLNKGFLNITLSISTLVLFLIIIVVGYVYVTRTDEQVDKINATLNKVNASINNFQKNSNHRWNITFEEFDRVAGAIDKVSDRLADNQIKNLNLTKFNRAALLDSNIMIHKLWNNLTGENICLENPLSNCIIAKNITQLVTNYSRSSTD
jgi:predicted MPP superfamily phosphohydrolase